MIAMPTTAGTGSEVGRSGVVTLDANHRKTVIFSPHLLANVAMLDPEMTRTMPPHVTAATGFDALTHCIEAYVARGDHPMADGIALEGIRLCAAHLERAVTHGDDLEARGGMLKAAMMGAVAFQKGLGACHSLAHPLSSEHGVHHGLANALCLVAVVRFNGGVAGERLGRVAALLGGKADAEGCAEALRALKGRIGITGALGEAGVPRGTWTGSRIWRSRMRATRSIRGRVPGTICAGCTRRRSRKSVTGYAPSTLRRSAGPPAGFGLDAWLMSASVQERPAPPETCQMFETPLIERFSRIHPAAPFVFWLPGAGLRRLPGLVTMGGGEPPNPLASGTSVPAFAALLVAGALLWTFAEYTLHRWVFHYTGPRPWQRRMFFVAPRRPPRLPPGRGPPGDAARREHPAGRRRSTRSSSSCARAGAGGAALRGVRARLPGVRRHPLRRAPLPHGIARGAAG